MGLQFQESITVYDKDGRPARAKLASCAECGNKEFILYVILAGKKKHEHVQCIQCGASYCDNSCAKDT